MKYLIVIPTFKGHLDQVVLFLDSFIKFCEDANEIGIRLVISKNERPLFEVLEKRWRGQLDIDIVDLQDIILHEENIQLDEDELLKEVGKFNFQAIKKLYGVKYFQYEMALVIDSEALIVRPCRFYKVFEDFSKDKFVIYSRHTGNEFQRKITLNCTRILGRDFIDMWMFEYQYWIFEKSIVESLFKSVFDTSKLSILQQFRLLKPIFEFNLYCAFIYFGGAENYRFIDSEELLKKHLSVEEFLKFESKMKEYDSTLFEYFPWGLASGNISGFKSLFQSLSMKFFKYDDRHQVSDNVEMQVKFIREVDAICLLPCRVVCKSFNLDHIVILKNHSIEVVWHSVLKDIIRPLKIKFIQIVSIIRRD